MTHRTILLFDEETRKAAKQLASHYDCSTSEAVRRAVVSHRDTVFGVSKGFRRQRVKALHRLFELFDGHDAAAEIRRLKSENEYF